METLTGPVAPVGPNRVSEQECKFVCLHRETTIKIQQFLSYVSVAPSFSTLISQPQTCGMCLSKILQEYVNKKGTQHFNKNFSQLLWKDNIEKFLINQPTKQQHQILFKADIDISQLDISVITPILQKIPYFATCSKALHISSSDANKIKHLSTSCIHSFVCCGKCLQCVKCSNKCVLSNLQLNHARTMRNKVHLTPQEFHEINEIVQNNPNHEKAIEWKANIGELAECIKTICRVISPDGTCYKDCQNCKSIDNIVNKENEWIYTPILW